MSEATHPKSDQNTLPFYHMCDSSTNMGYPAVNRFKVTVEDVYAAMNIRHKNAGR